MLTIELVIILISTYFFASMSFAIILSTIFKTKDPRTTGSGNPGATNMLRSSNLKLALLTLFLDLIKGWLPVVISFKLHATVLQASIVGFVAFIGHIFPIYYKFSGGKGVATTLGISLAISLYSFVISRSCILIVFAIFRYVSLASLI